MRVLRSPWNCRSTKFACRATPEKDSQVLNQRSGCYAQSKNLDDFGSSHAGSRLSGHGTHALFLLESDKPRR
jgi:hypothetical protein